MVNNITVSIDQLIRPVSNQVGVAVWQDGHEIYHHRQHIIFPAASLIKLPILAGTMAAVQSGRIALNQTIQVSKAQMVGGSGVLQLLPNRTWQLQELLALMIADSDNTATNQVLQLVGFDWLKEWINEQVAEVSLERKMMDWQAVAAGRDNQISPQAVARCLQMLLAPQPHAALIHSWFRHQQFRDKLPADFDELDWPITVLNKTGEGPGIDHDAARLINVDGHYIDVVLLTANISDRVTAKTLFSQIGQLVAEILLNPNDYLAE